MQADESCGVLPLYRAVTAMLIAFIIWQWWRSKESSSRSAPRLSDGELGVGDITGDTADPNDRGPEQGDGKGEDEDSGALAALANAKHIPFKSQVLTPDQMQQRATSFYQQMDKRRSLRFFSPDAVPPQVIEDLVRTASTGPSGAHQQPWFFTVVSSQKIKDQIREVVEAEERVNYERRMGAQWVADLKPIGTDWHKEYLSIAPYIILVWKQVHGVGSDGKRRKHYYVEIGVSIAAGLLVAAIHNAGLVTLTSTPMNAGPKIRDLVGRPSSEKLLLLLPVGLPAADATVPNLTRKPLDQVCQFV